MIYRCFIAELLVPHSPAIQMVSAWATTNKLVLGQVKVDEILAAMDNKYLERVLALA
ncbi:hypothetical protein H6G80_08825 [Nostoc sp. FACHB-87]|uniref:hypothetical protein n=1 Tax=Nostocaceae TaxID=1162 RepID=UPI0016853C37|nr:MULTISPECIES: hypothetical protein [Nostocaceae]MBD2454182.1 hypothetical protein [Nostoc sp. FACHB-87]MBD2476121.1 hypothetical protein [Anabaena sp. FACHB-83]